MAEIRKEITVDRSPEEVWAVVGDPLGLIDCFPEAETRMEGDDRIVSMGGLETREQIVSRDDATRRYDYRIVSAPFEYTSHQAWMQVEADGDGCRVVWVTTIEPAELETLFAPMFDEVMQRVKATIEAD